MLRPDPAAVRSQYKNHCEAPHPDDQQHVTILNVNTETYTCDVVTGRTRQYIANVPWPTRVDDATITSGEVIVPKTGQQYTLLKGLDRYRLGAPVQPDTMSPPTAEHRVAYGTTATDAVGNLTTSIYNKRGSLPSDVQGGDWLRVGKQGQMIGVLTGGNVVLKGSEAAKIVAGAVGDKIRIDSRNLTINTDFGPVEFTNDNGLVALKVRGGSKQLTEASPKEEKYTIHFDAGQSGGLARFRITDQAGRTASEVHYAPNGDVSVITNNNTTDVTGNRLTVIAGTDVLTNTSYTVTTAGMYSLTATTVVTKAIGGSASFGSSADVSFSAGQNMDLSAGRNHTTTVMGDMVNPVATVHKTYVANGSMKVEVGTPATASLPATLGNYTLTAKGLVKLSSATGRMELGTGGVPNTIALSGTTYGLVLYEHLETLLKTLGQVLNTHTHPLAASAGAVPVTGVASPVAAPIWTPATEASLKLSRSTLITAGA